MKKTVIAEIRVNDNNTFGCSKDCQFFHLLTRNCLLFGKLGISKEKPLSGNVFIPRHELCIAADVQLTEEGNIEYTEVIEAAKNLPKRVADKGTICDACICFNCKDFDDCAPDCCKIGKCPHTICPEEDNSEKEKYCSNCLCLICLEKENCINGCDGCNGERHNIVEKCENFKSLSSEEDNKEDNKEKERGIDVYCRYCLCFSCIYEENCKSCVKCHGREYNIEKECKEYKSIYIEK